MIPPFETWAILEALDESKYHLYIIYRSSPNKPLYVGSGTTDRTRVSLSNFEDKHGEAKLKVLQSFSSKDKAFDAEVELVKKHGLKSEGGTLLMSRIGNQPSEELKKKHSESNRNNEKLKKPKSTDHKAKIASSMKGQLKSDSHKAKIASSVKGKPKPDSQKKKIALSMKGNQNAAKS